jgi:hypothetical protein
MKDKPKNAMLTIRYPKGTDMAKERKRLDNKAKKLGYKDKNKMIRDLIS